MTDLGQCVYLSLINKQPAAFHIIVVNSFLHQKIIHSKQFEQQHKLMLLWGAQINFPFTEDFYKQNFNSLFID